MVTPTYVPMQNPGGLAECCPSYAGTESRSGLASTVALGLEPSTQTSGERLRGRPSCPEYCRPTFACANNERRFGLARRVAVDLESPTQTSGERLQGRPSCPTRCHLTSVARHVIATRPPCSSHSIIPPFAARWPGRRYARSSRYGGPPRAIRAWPLAWPSPSGPQGRQAFSLPSGGMRVIDGHLCSSPAISGSAQEDQRVCLPRLPWSAQGELLCGGVAVNSAQALRQQADPRVSGMARVRSGWALPWALVSDRSVRTSSGIKRDFA
jgi:hypothetical protein